MAAVLQGISQSPDMHVDGSLLNVYVVAPHLVEQLRARIDAFGMRHEEMQQTIFGGAKQQGLPIAADAPAGRIELQAARLDHDVGHLRGTPAQHGLDARIQLVEAPVGFRW